MPRRHLQQNLGVNQVNSKDSGMAENTDNPNPCKWPSPLDMKALAATEPRPPQWIMNGWLPAGYATLLSGHGGTGKSTITLFMAACIALGIDFCGLRVEQRKVLYLSAEDRANDLHGRLSHICSHLGVDLASLDDQLFVLDLVGWDTILWTANETGRGQTTPAYKELERLIETTAADVVIVDGITDAYAGKELDRGQIKSFVNSLLALIDPQRGAVLMLGHTNKLTAQGVSTSEGYSGSTQWHNAVRSRMYLYPETERDEEDGERRNTGKVTLALEKSNLGAVGHRLTFEWNAEAGLFVGRKKETDADVARREQAERSSILEALTDCASRGDYVPAAGTGRRTAYHVLVATGQLARTLCRTSAARKRFWRRVEELRAMGKIRESWIRRGDGHKVRTLELVSPGNG